MKESEEVSSYITRVLSVANQMKQNGDALNDARIVEKILQTLTDKFENVVCVIEESKNLEEMTVDELVGSLEACEQRKKKKQLETLNEVLQAKATVEENKVLYAKEDNQGGRGGYGDCGRGGGRCYERRKDRGVEGDEERRVNNRANVDCYNCGRYGHYARYCKFAKGANIQCHNCGKRGHVARNCRAPRQVAEKSNLIEKEESDDDGVLLMAQKNTNNNSVWYLNTGASNHMTRDESLFKELREVEAEDVFFAWRFKLA